MSERACNEAIANMYNDLTEIRGQYNDLKSEIVEISTNVKWMREGIEKINNSLEKCAACKNPDELLKKLDNAKKDIRDIKDTDIRELRDSHSKTKYVALGISAGVSFITMVILFILKIKEVI